jgi:hypothetical protein
MLVIAAAIALSVNARAQGKVLSVGEKVPDYTFKMAVNAEGRTSFAALRGKVILVDFWGYH